MSNRVMQGQVIQAREAASEWRVLDPAQWSPQKFPNVLEVTRGGTITLYHPETNLAVYDEAIVAPRSDLIILPRSDSYWVVWEKFFLPNMCKTQPQDRNLIAYDWSLRSPGVEFSLPERVRRLEAAVSLLGANAWHWGHFLTEYLTRLVITMRYLGEVEVAVLVPAELDPNCLDLVRSVLAAHPQATLIGVEKDEAISCGRLYLASKGAYLCDHSQTISPNDIVVRHWAPAAIEEAIDLFKKQQSLPTVAPMPALLANSEKLYFPRKLGYRSLENADQITQLMIDAGYELLEPSILSLAEKLEILDGVSHVALTAGSSGFNALFCRPGTKFLTVSPYIRAFDVLGPTLRPDVEFDLVTGVDLSPDIHTDFAVSEARVLQGMSAFGFCAPADSPSGPGLTPHHPTAFLHHADGSSSAWVDLLECYLATFHAGEPVALVLSLEDGISTAEVESIVLGLVEKTGRPQFPPVLLLNPEEDRAETLSQYEFVVPVPFPAPDGPFPNLKALRLGKSLVKHHSKPA